VETGAGPRAAGCMHSSPGERLGVDGSLANS
jgi:hypothetical protein